MNIGDTLTLKPTLYTQFGFQDAEAAVCTVVYIHPLRRFFVVEFRRGEFKWRETLYFEQRPSESDARERHREKRHMPRHYGRML